MCMLRGKYIETFYDVFFKIDRMNERADRLCDLFSNMARGHCVCLVENDIAIASSLDLFRSRNLQHYTITQKSCALFLHECIVLHLCFRRSMTC